ncbi:MAG: ATP-binding protein [Ferruginibacter sp.]
MRYFFSTLFFVVLLLTNAIGQDANTDSLKKALYKAAPDSNKVELLFEIADAYYFSRPDSCLAYSLQARNVAKNLQMNVAEIRALNYSGEALRFLGDYPGALNMQFEALRLSRKIKNRLSEASSLGFIGLTYTEFGEYKLGLQFLLLSGAINKDLPSKTKYTFDLTNIGNAYDLLGRPDSALYYQLKALQAYTGLIHGPLKSLTLTRLGNAYASKGRLDSALAIYYRAMENCFRVGDKVNISKVQGRIARLYLQKKEYDSSIHYARLAFRNANLSNQRLEILENSMLLSSLYRNQFRNADSALFYLDKAAAMKDSLYGQQKFRQLQRLMLDQQQQQQQVVQEQEQYRNKIKYIILFIVLGIVLLVSFLLLRNNQHKQKAKLKIEAAYNELKDTQQQLVQKEKMASLGELTAGIAHEIQNPLNFVNNFAEVNIELIGELQQEVKAGKIEGIVSIANDIRDNEQKIVHHGKRADAIVKGMLQHSRGSTGTRVATDINALCDEYLRLSYHGLRARDNTFNAKIETDLDPAAGMVNMIPQDIGRVIINLLTNAFYAVSERKERSEHGYEPVVSISTKKLTDKVVIQVKDNGSGIPQKLINKIFQPFFTTKPTGQGTGLGLSLSYDIVKAHGGELKVETTEGEGSVFTIQLPAN